MNARQKTKSFINTRGLGTLLALSLATACQPEINTDPDEDTEPVPGAELVTLPLNVERRADAPLFSWEGGKVHRFEVIECNEPPTQTQVRACACSGALVWGLGPAESEAFHEVAREQPFIESPVEYGVTPASDRKGYEARPLVEGRTYIVRADQVGTCAESPEGCQQVKARGCQSFVW